MRRGAKSAAGMVLGLDYNRSHSPELNYIEMMSRLMCLDHVSGSLGVSICIRPTKVLPGRQGVPSLSRVTRRQIRTAKDFLLMAMQHAAR